MPVRDLDGYIIALKVRQDAPGDGNKYVYVSSGSHGGPGPGSPVHVPRGVTKAPIVRVKEGELKADVATALDGIPTIGIAGVAIWRPALEVLAALGNPTVRLAFDADAADNPKVAAALAACYAGLVAIGLTVELEQWDKAAGKGIDDLLANGGRPTVLQGDDARAAVAAMVENPDDADGPLEFGPYFVEGNSTYRWHRTGESESRLRLANFIARIGEECVRDDGAEQSLHFAVEGTLHTGAKLPRVTVSAADFVTMNWVFQHWGLRAIISVGQSVKDHLRMAIQEMSQGAPRSVVHLHTGWFRVGDRWIFLHAGGGIGQDGPVDVTVQLPDELARYALPVPPVGAALADAVRASLAFLDVGPWRLTVPLLAAVYRSLMKNVDFSLFLAGPSGAYKSEVAALAQQHFGPELDARHLPASWSSTDNALEMTAFHCKDVLLVIDDFCPKGSTQEIQSLHSKADRVLRAQGNNSARHRLRSDSTLRPAKPVESSGLVGLVRSTKGDDTAAGDADPFATPSSGPYGAGGDRL